MIIHGVDDQKRVYPLLVDASGQPIISASSLITSGSKLNLDTNGNLRVVNTNLYGVSPFRRILSMDNLALAAGVNTLTVGTVTNGETWQVDQIMIRYDGTVAGVTAIVRQLIGGVGYVHYQVTAFVTAIWQVFNINLISDSATQWEVVVTGATLNDDIRVRVYARALQN